MASMVHKNVTFFVKNTKKTAKKSVQFSPCWIWRQNVPSVCLFVCLFVCLSVCLFVCPGGGQGGGRGAVCPYFGFKSVLISFLIILDPKTFRNDVKNSPTQKSIPPHKPGTPSTDTATQFLFLVVRRGGLVVINVI